MSDPEARDPAPQAASDDRRGRRRRALLWGGLVLFIVLLLTAGVLVWWFGVRNRGPVITGEIDDEALTRPVRLCVDGQRSGCRTIAETEALLEGPPLTIRQAEATSGGVQGAIALAVEDADGTRIRAKWRAQASASLVNEPAKELAAYRLQAMMLAPHDYVIPPVAGHCFALDDYRREVDPGAEPVEGSRCVFGFLTYWLVGGTTVPEARDEGILPMPERGKWEPDPLLFDAERFAEGGAYRRNMALLNLITYLVNNGDAHAGQFIVYEEPFHAFVIDSSISFRSIRNPRSQFLQNLADLIVPSLPAEVAARIDVLSRDALEELLVLEEYRLGEDGLRRTEPGAPFDTDERVRREGDRLQIGLRVADLDDLWERVATVQQRLHDGELTTF